MLSPSMTLRTGSAQHLVAVAVGTRPFGRLRRSQGDSGGALSQTLEWGREMGTGGVMLSGAKHLVARGGGTRPFGRLRRPQGDR